MTRERRVAFSRDFTRDVKSLKRTFRRIAEDLAIFVERLKHGETPGDLIPGVGHTVYKTRIRNSDMQRGKSGGYRIIYYLRTADYIILLTIYAKTQKKDVSTTELRRIIAEVEAEESL
jgi:mRNA-degrading endonuclease RelE of RelBE toxin-antitoxin system